MNSKNSKEDMVMGGTGLKPTLSLEQSLPAEPSLVSQTSVHLRPDSVRVDA